MAMTGTMMRCLVLVCISLWLVGCSKTDGGAPVVPPTVGEGQLCGGLAGVACADGQYCDMGAVQCGAADGQGVCRVKPDVCTEQYEPVCGCDGKTYGNACVAASMGTSVLHEGECK